MNALKFNYCNNKICKKAFKFIMFDLYRSAHNFLVLNCYLLRYV